MALDRQSACNHRDGGDGKEDDRSDRSGSQPQDESREQEVERQDASRSGAPEVAEQEGGGGGHEDGDPPAGADGDRRGVTEPQ